LGEIFNKRSMVKGLIANLILKFSPKKLKQIFNYEVEYRIEEKLKFSQLSFAQESEDLVLNKIFGNQSNGFFIDIGANHPIRFSNTWFFYKKGWRGINIEPNPEMFKLLQQYRPHDLNLNIGISDKKGLLNYFMFNEPALNTFSEYERDQYLQKSEYSLEKELKVDVDTLESVFKENNISRNQAIDFMSIDAEGFDLKVLQSFDISVYTPKVILIEILEIKSMLDVMNNDIYVYLTSKNYYLYLRTGNTFIFRKD
jgi:FkbM family methyltransferase